MKGAAGKSSKRAGPSTATKLDKGNPAAKTANTFGFWVRLARTPLVLGAVVIALLAYSLYPVNLLDGHLWRPDQGYLSHTGDSDSDASKFALADLPGRGKGLVAVRDIERGELLIREKPLFRVPFSTSNPKGVIAEGLRAASPEGRAAFFDLSYVGLPDDFDPASDPDAHALAIFQTNAVAAGDMVGIFPRMARLNHGCVRAFNSVYSWREKEGALVVHALKPIAKGEELLTTYFDTKRARDDRRAHLKERYGFECNCSVCALPEAKSSALDRQLADMVNEYARLASWAEGKITGLEAIRTVRLLWRLGTSTGYHSERGRLAADAAWVAAAHQDASATRAWAALAKELYAYELGVDSPEVEEAGRVLSDPSAHPAWGTRQRLAVGDTRGLR